MRLIDIKWSAQHGVSQGFPLYLFVSITKSIREIRYINARLPQLFLFCLTDLTTYHQSATEDLQAAFSLTFFNGIYSGDFLLLLELPKQWERHSQIRDPTGDLMSHLDLSWPFPTSWEVIVLSGRPELIELNWRDLNPHHLNGNNSILCQHWRGGPVMVNETAVLIPSYMDEKFRCIFNRFLSVSGRTFFWKPEDIL